MRLEDDGNPRNSSPHILARKLEESYVFELWVEKECIMGNMGIATSIASFFHLVFCFNLKYPKVLDFCSNLIHSPNYFSRSPKLFVIFSRELLLTSETMKVC